MSLNINHRKHKRFERSFKATFIRNSKKLTNRGVDISENGFSIIMDEKDVAEFMMFRGASLKIRIDSIGHSYIIQKAIIRNALARNNQGKNTITLGFEIIEIDRINRSKHIRFVEGSDHTSTPPSQELELIKHNIEQHKDKQHRINEFNLFDQSTWPKKTSKSTANESEYVCTDQGIARLNFTSMQWTLVNTGENIDASDISKWTDKI